MGGRRAKGGEKRGEERPGQERAKRSMPEKWGLGLEVITGGQVSGRASLETV